MLCLVCDDGGINRQIDYDDKQALLSAEEFQNVTVDKIQMMSIFIIFVIIFTYIMLIGITLDYDALAKV